MERDLAERLAHNEQLAGYNKCGEAFSYALLAGVIEIPKAPPKVFKAWGETAATFDKIRAEMAGRPAPFHVSLLGYAGWSETNTDYLAERDERFKTWAQHLALHGIPRSGPTFFGSIPHADLFRRVSNSKEIQFLDAFQQFYARWRLQHLVTKELPEPLAPQFPIHSHLALLTHMCAGGVSLYQPDTMPVPPRDKLRDILEDQRVARGSAHLTSWIRIVGRSRRSDHAIKTYGRIFILQHYWALLKERHPQTVRGNVRLFEEAFGKFFGVREDAVHKYRQRIKRRLQAS